MVGTSQTVKPKLLAFITISTENSHPPVDSILIFSKTCLRYILKPFEISVDEIPKSKGVKSPAVLERAVFKIPPPIFSPSSVCPARA